MLKNVSPGLIENVKDLKIALNELTVHDLNVYSMSELYYKVAHKLNEVINELSRFEGVLSDEVIKQNEKLIYLLGEGLEIEVVKEIDNLIKKGFFEEIINVKIFSDLNNKIDTFKSDLNNKVDTFKSEIDSQLEHIENKNLINVKYPNFNLDAAKGNGIDNDTIAINNIIDFVNNNGLDGVYFPKGKYMIQGHNDDGSFKDGGIGVRISKPIYIKLHPEAELHAIPNDKTHYAILNIRDTNNVVVSGGCIIGERSRHTGNTGEFGFGIIIHQCENVVIENVTVKDCWGDGIILSKNYNDTYKQSKNIKIKNVILDNNRRQGLSIINGENIIVDSCVIKNTNGVAPQCGIDIEPDGDGVSQYANNVKIINNTFSNNKVSDIVLGGGIGCKNVLISNNTFENTKTSVILANGLKVTENVIIANNMINSVSNGVTSVIDIKNSNNVTVLNNSILNTSSKGGVGISVTENNNITDLTNNKIYNFENAISLSKQSNINTKIIQNHITTCSCAIMINETINNILIEGNIFNDISLFGIYARFTNSKISNNIFSNIQRSAFTSDPTNCQISNNKFIKCGLENPSIYPFFRWNSIGCIVLDNIFDGGTENQWAVLDDTTNPSIKSLYNNNYALFSNNGFRVTNHKSIANYNKNDIV